MAQFEDDFRRSDRDIHSDGGWVVLDEAGDSTGVLEIRDGYLTTSDGTSPAIAAQTGTVPTTFKQDVAADITATVEGANSFIDVGLGYAATGSDLTEHPRTIAARFRWSANGARRLEIVSRLRLDSEIVHKAIDLVAAGGVVNQRYEGDIRGGGALGEMQLVYLQVERVDAGLRAQVFLNNRDFSRPIATAVIGQGYPPPDTSDETDPGAAFLFFGANSSAGSLRATFFGFSDTVEETIDLGAPDGTDGTMRYLIGLVRMRLGRGASQQQTNIDPEVIRHDLRDAVEHIMNELGDKPYWAVREEELTLTFTGYEATLPASVKRVHAVFRPGSDREMVFWRYLRHDTDGRPVIWVQPGTPETLVVRYIVRHTPFVEDDDVCPIPREHQELVVVMAALRSAEREQRFVETRNALLARSRELMAVIHRDVGRHMNLARDMYAPVRTLPPRRYGRMGWR